MIHELHYSKVHWLLSNQSLRKIQEHTRHVSASHWDPSKLKNFNTEYFDEDSCSYPLVKNLKIPVEMRQFTRIQMTHWNVSFMVQNCCQLYFAFCSLMELHNQPSTHDDIIFLSIRPFCFVENKLQINKCIKNKFHFQQNAMAWCLWYILLNIKLLI